MTEPRVHLSLIDYVSSRWGISRRQARLALLGGKVNVNGEVWAYPDIPVDTIQHDERGRLRIMVEGRADPRGPWLGESLEGLSYARKRAA